MTHFNQYHEILIQYLYLIMHRTNGFVILAARKSLCPLTLSDTFINQLTKPLREWMKCLNIQMKQINSLGLLLKQKEKIVYTNCN